MSSGAQYSYPSILSHLCHRCYEITNMLFCAHFKKLNFKVLFYKRKSTVYRVLSSSSLFSSYYIERS